MADTSGAVRGRADKFNGCCNLFPNHNVLSGMGEDSILAIRWSFDSFQGDNSCCNTCISKILTSFPSPVWFNCIACVRVRVCVLRVCVCRRRPFCENIMKILFLCSHLLTTEEGPINFNKHRTSKMATGGHFERKF